MAYFLYIVRHKNCVRMKKMPKRIDKAIQPKRNYRKLYECIAESKWFADSYKGKSVGEFIEFEL